MRKSLTKKEIIRSQYDIDRIFKQGKKFSCMGMRLVAVENDFSFDRFIVIPAKHYGRAVDRNRIRRQVKELWRVYPKRTLSSLRSNLSSGHDIALVMYPGKVLEFSLLESQLYNLLDRFFQE